jgi:hypothetical protein
MTTFRRISETISSFWAPKPQRQQPTSPTSSPSAPSHQHQSAEHSLHHSPQSPRRRRLLTGTHLEYKSFSAVDDLLARSLAYELENIEDDVSNIVQSIELMQDEDNPSQDGANEEDGEGKTRDRKNLLDQLQHGIDIREKYRQQLKDATKLSELGWRHDSILAYLKIARRGYEPAFPPSWRYDFPKFPPLLFAKDEESAFVKPIKKSNFAALKAFDRLCMMGQSVRLAEENHTGPNRSPEAMIKKHLNDYLKWAWSDAALTEDVESGRVPCLITLSKRSTRRLSVEESTTDILEPFVEIELKIKKKLEEMSNILLDALRHPDSQEEYIIEPPTLFGLVIHDTIVAVVAYEPLAANTSMRQFAFYHFNKINEEIWNCISLSILIAWIRNGMIRIKEALDKIEHSTEDISSSQTST